MDLVDGDDTRRERVRWAYAYEDFAALHVRFAARVCVVVGVGLREALRLWTPAFALSGEGWQGATLDASGLARAYRRAGVLSPPSEGFGCFSYAVEADGSVVRLHFANREGSSALSAGRLAVRRDELAAALGHARTHHPHADTVRGGSWLYHLPAYRTLFPPRLLATATPEDPADELTFLALWGQFLRGDGRLYQPRAAQFIQRFDLARDPAGLLAAFPLSKLEWQGPLDEVLAHLVSSG